MNNDVIVLIDTGLDKEIYRNRIVGGIHFYIEDEMICCDKNYNDDNGHGTACADVITRVYKNARFFVIKILNSEAETNYPLLEMAMEYCISLEYRLINLSLAMLQEDSEKKLREICQCLLNRGKVIVASVYNGEKKSFPALFSTVIGVRGNRFELHREYWFDNNKEIQCIGDLTPIFTRWDREKFYLFGGNSKACAYIAGYIIKTCADENIEINFNNACCILKKYAVRTEWKEIEINCSKEPHIYENCLFKDEINKKVKELLYRITGNKEVLNIGIYTSLFDENVLNRDTCKKLIKLIEETFNIVISENLIDYDSIGTLSGMTNMIESLI